MNLRRLLLSVGLSLLIPFVNAQESATGSLRGTVTIEDGQVIPGANIVAADQQSGETYKTISNSDGQWVIWEAAVGGPYTLEASLTGFKTDVKKDMQVKLEQTTIVNFVLQIEQID
ncbi:MAG: carboxypeptidase-like regulatory domain-containing protein [Pseudomonadota bacterium]